MLYITAYFTLAAHGDLRTSFWWVTVDCNVLQLSYIQGFLSKHDIRTTGHKKHQSVSSKQRHEKLISQHQIYQNYFKIEINILSLIKNLHSLLICCSDF